MSAAAVKSQLVLARFWQDSVREQQSLARAFDALDLRLLAQLQCDNMQTADQLGEEIGLSPSALARRIRRLRSGGTIIGEVAVLSDAIITGGSSEALRAVLQIKLQRHSLDVVEAFRRSLVQSPYVQFCLEVSGDFDIMVLAVFPSMDDFNRFADEMIAGSPVVLRYETSFVKKRLKMSLALPLQD